MSEWVGLAGALTLSVGLALGLARLLLGEMFRMLPAVRRMPMGIAPRPRQVHLRTNVAQVRPHAA
ncbi:MAG: hypothetical protein L0387_43515 [Acidobacteria bacterium]|nr:hypothetical protein [Acidobacteriota bacterium]